MFKASLNDVYHGWYSQSAVDAGHGTAIYRDADGVEREVTEAAITSVPFSKWPDAVYLGVVGKWCRHGKPQVTDWASFT